MQIHIFNDEKFVDTTIQNFEKASPNDNIYLILVSNTNLPLSFVKSLDKVYVFNKIDYVEIENLLLSIHINALLVHFLSKDKIDLIRYLRKKMDVPPIVWFFWGADAFNFEKFESKLYQDKTKKYFIDDRLGFSKKLRKSLLLLLQNSGIYLKDFLRYRSNIKFITTIDYIVPVLYEDYVSLKSFYHLKGKYIDCNYLSIEQMIGDNIDEYVDGGDILVGNSATITNNHIEIIDALSKLDLQNRLVYIPLNYGVENYKNEIIEYGIKRLGKNFIPLTDFMPLQEYNNILKTCGIIIMNHNRQQAVGNIIATLWMGGKLIMNEESTVYTYLKRLGVKVYSTKEELLINKTEIFKRPEKSVIDDNRRILYNYWSNEVILGKISMLIQTLRDQNKN